MINTRNLVAILILVICGCNNKEYKYSQQYKIMDELLNNLSKNDTIAVRRMIGVENLKSIGRDEHGLNFNIKEISELIGKFGYPEKKNYKLTEYPENSPELVDIEVPVFNGQSTSLTKATLTVKFVKYLPSDKILDFRLEEEYKRDNKPIDSVRNF